MNAAVFNCYVAHTCFAAIYPKGAYTAQLQEKKHWKSSYRSENVDAFKQYDLMDEWLIFNLNHLVTIIGKLAESTHRLR